MSGLINLKDVSFETKPGVFLFKNLSVTFGKEKSGLVGVNGIGKTTLARLIAGKAEPFSGKIERDVQIAYLPQDYQIDLDASVRQTLGIGKEHEALSALSKTGLDATSLDRQMGSLSGGERTRVVLASLLLDPSSFLILDEPTNNLDQEARAAIYDLAKNWRGGLLVISHDRALLGYVDRILELSDKGLKIYGGNYEFYREQKDLEIEAVHRQLSDAERDLSKTERQAEETLERQGKKSAHGKKTVFKLGLPKIIVGAMKRRAQGTSGKLKKIHDEKIKDAQRKFEEAKARVSEDNRIVVRLEKTKVPNSKLIVSLKEVGFGYGSNALFNDLNLSIYGPERIAISGPNGSGKTTLVKIITKELASNTGEVVLGVDSFAYLDQHVNILDPDLSILENLRNMSGLDETIARHWLADFLFRSDEVFKKVSVLSGGERMRAALVCILAGEKPPQLLILDEPTNSLDLNSIERIESALQNYQGALIVISHDKKFLENIGINREINL